MTYERPGRGVYLIAPGILTHGAAHYQAGLVGIVQKQDEPRTFDSLTVRQQVASGAQYFLRTKREAQVPAIAGATLGAAVAIATADDTLSLGAPGTGTVAFGRVSGLPGTFGCPVGQMRVDMDLKDNI